VDNQYSLGSENAPAILSLKMNLRFTRDMTIIPYLAHTFYIPNCITENVTMGSIVASGKMLLSDRQKSLSEEPHDEPEKQARIVGSSATQILESQ
jgi:hypothetical protein